jgi:hypothetical protein
MTKIESWVICCLIQLYPITSISDVSPNDPVMMRCYTPTGRSCLANGEHNHKERGIIGNCNFLLKYNSMSCFKQSLKTTLKYVSIMKYFFQKEIICQHNAI